MTKKWIARIARILSLTMVLSCLPVESSRAAEVKEPVVDYLLVNQPEQQEGEEQTVVISLGEGAEKAEAMELYVKDEAGNVYTLQPEKNEEGAYAFQKIFEKGIYYIDSVMLTVDGAQITYVMSEMGIEACFSVGVDCPEEEKSEHMEVESIPAEEVEVETSVVTIEEDGTTTETTIEEALEEAAFSTGAKARTVASAKAVQDEVVIVLDPGHDSQHQGAYYNSIKEHEAVFKIAKYCKEELETYGGVTVYLTRETEKCPYPGSSSNIDDIKKRVKDAHEKGADAYVSIHLNAHSNKSANGAEVYYHSKSTAGKKLSQKIQDELVDLGLYDRGVKSYDAYAVVKAAQSYGFPGIIVEHAFLSNKSDVNKYLKSEESLKALGIADAAGIAEYFKLPKIGTRLEVKEGAYYISNEVVPEQVLSVKDNMPALSAAEKLASQRFEIMPAGDKSYHLTAEDTGMAVSIANDTVQMEVLDSNSDDQRWYFLESGAEHYYLRSVSGKYLAVSENGLVAVPAADTVTQQWKISKASDRPIENLTPKLVSVKNSDESVVVKWKELTGAQGYQIYRKTGAEDWTLIGTVAGEDKTSFTDAEVSANTTYTYTVKAYKDETVSLYNNEGIAVTTPAKKTYTKYRATTDVNYRSGAGTSKSKKGVLLEGDIVEVEDGYSKSVNGVSWCRVKINSKSYYVAFKYLEKYVSLSKPTLSSVKYSDGAVTVKWKKVSNAKGYYVYRKTGSGSYERIKTIKSGSTVQYKDSSIKASKKYTYRIKAYHGGNKSSYSSTKSVTAPKTILIKYAAKQKVNYRSNAGTKYKVKGTLKKGKTVSVVKDWSKKKNGFTWYKIKINGKYYYVVSKYLKKK